MLTENRTLGRNLTLIMFEKNITQRELAKVCGVSPPLISQFISGKRVPKLETFKIMADYLGVTMDELLKGERWD